MESIKSFFLSYRSECLLIGISILLLAGSALFFFTEHNSVPEAAASSLPIHEERMLLNVEVNGAVRKPDVYSFPEGTRLKEVIQKAELSKEADILYISRTFNMARFIKDQEKIYVPSKDEVSEGLFSSDLSSLTQNISISSPQLSQNSSLIDVNLATLAELDSLPGIGKTTAQKIIDQRPYSSLNELTDKKVFTIKQLTELSSYLTAGE